MTMKTITIAVIGTGISGLAAIKEFVEQGFGVVALKNAMKWEDYGPIAKTLQSGLLHGIQSSIPQSTWYYPSTPRHYLILVLL